MAKCLNCGEDVPQTPGKRAKKYCNDRCRMAYNRKVITEQKAITNITEQALPNNSEQPVVALQVVRPRGGLLTKERQVSRKGFNDG